MAITGERMGVRYRAGKAVTASTTSTTSRARPGQIRTLLHVLPLALGLLPWAFYLLAFGCWLLAFGFWQARPDHLRGIKPSNAPFLSLAKVEEIQE